jgi:transcriptional regulator with GAF, ATPase, and Fis domain
MGIPTWHRYIPASCEEKYLNVLEELRKCHVEPRDDNTDIGLLFFTGRGEELLPGVREGCRSIARILAVALGEEAPNAEICWQLLEAGASDVVWWSGSRTIAQDIYERLDRWKSIEQDLRSPIVRNYMVGESRVWTATVRELIEIARYHSGQCLLQGESGTGKELAARLIHTLDGREDKGELVIVDCSTIAAELSGSEFFGHERGAYTGASSRREGAFSIANGGTLFLDEVGELPLPLQAQLLRVIQEGTYKPLGANTWQRTSFRLVCATNRDLASDVSRGRFRTDLYYRIAGAVVTLPPLRQRKEDVIPLAKHFMRETLPGGFDREIDKTVKAYLLGLEYSGNVRELRQIVMRMCQRHAGKGPLTLGDLAPEDLPGEVSRRSVWHDGAFESCIQRAVFEGASLKEIGKRATDCAIQVALENSQGNVRLAAGKLGVTDRALQIRRAVRREASENGTGRRTAT